LSLVVHCIEVS